VTIVVARRRSILLERRAEVNRNPFKLDFQEQAAMSFRVVVKIVKVYPVTCRIVNKQQGEQS
jgi:hypothetical protein